LTESPVRSERKSTCTDHCSACGRHFHGLAAFDAHRVDSACIDPSTAENSKGKSLLQVWVTDGFCDKVAGCWVDGRYDHHVHPVTIWQTFKTEAQVEQLASLRSRQAALL